MQDNNGTTMQGNIDVMALRQADLERRRIRDEKRGGHSRQVPAPTRLEDWAKSEHQRQKKIAVEGRRAISREMARVRESIAITERFRDMWQAEARESAKALAVFDGEMPEAVGVGDPISPLWSREWARRDGERVYALKRQLRALELELREADRMLDQLSRRRRS